MCHMIAILVVFLFIKRVLYIVFKLKTFKKITNKHNIIHTKYILVSCKTEIQLTLAIQLFFKKFYKY